MSSFSDKIAAAADAINASSIPAILKNYSLLQLIGWYEGNLSCKDWFDPRKHQVVFDLSRLAYLIKLNDLSGEKLVKPLQTIEAIKSGELTDADFSSPDRDRAERLSWLSVIATEPLSIRKNDSKVIPADEVYTKQFARTGYLRFKRLYCTRMGESLLVPVTSFRTHHEPQSEILWSLK